MQQTTKKIIAQEILILFSAGISVILIWSGLMLYSLYYEHKNNILVRDSKAIQHKIDSLLNSDDTLYTKIDTLNLNEDDGQSVSGGIDFDGSVKKWCWGKLYVDSIRKYHLVIHGNSIFHYNCAKEDSFRKVLARPLVLKHEKVEDAILRANGKILPAADINFSALILACFILLIIYPLRLFILVIRWSIKTIRQPS